MTLYLLLSVPGFLVHNISEYNWLTSLFIYYFVFLVASMGFLCRESVPQVYNNSPLLKKTFMLPSMLFAVLLTGFTLSNYYKYNQIIVKKIPFSQTLGDTEYELRLAKNLCKQCRGPHYLSGFLKMEAYKSTRDPELPEEARKDFSEALIRNPYSSRFYFAEGDAFNFQGKKEEARYSYKMVMKNPKYALPALERIRTLGKINVGREP